MRCYRLWLGLLASILLASPHAGAIDITGRTVPESPPTVPDLNFNKNASQRVLCLP